MQTRRRVWWVLGMACLFAAAYWARVQHEMVDFTVYRTAAVRALDAEPLYQTADGHYQFKYLPVFALAVAPLALANAEHAKAAWFALTAGLLIAFIRWSVRALPGRRRSESALIWLTVLFMAKFYAHELTLGQTNILLGVLIVGGLLALHAGSPRAAGALIGAAVFVKPYALLLLPWLAVSAGATATLTAVGVVAGGLLAPAAVYGWAGNAALLAGWFETVTASTGGTLIGADNVSLAAMWAKWIGIGRPAVVLAAATTAAVLGMAILVWRRRRTVGSPAYLECALLMLLIPLISPQGWDYVLLLGTPAVVCLLDRWASVSTAWKTVIAASLVLMGLTIFDLMGRALYGRFMALSIVTVAALGVAVSLAHLRWKALA